MAELVSITSGKLTARINLLGAELWSVTDADGREYMTDADPAFWTGHAPILFPIVGELAGGTYRYEGKNYALPRHGFARRSRFLLVEHADGTARFRLTDSADTRAAYPFAFALELCFRLHDTRLEIVAEVTNLGPEPLPFSLGFHPGFAWPLPGGGDKLKHTIVFAEEEPNDIRLLDGDGLVADRAPSPVQGRTLKLSPDLFRRDALVWDRLQSRGVEYRGEQGSPILRVAFPDTPHLGIWQKPGANYVCIEPWQGHADPAGFDGELREKPGIVILPPGEVRRFRVEVTIDPPSGV
ncbi:aldose 1-epimerase family protein [Novosphingobium sp. M1R2S20]|uniref:Aldose 1-epimerase family protein n=1 Tax=Novosphingobium rhizovicinum TaxID=3228928 RepID=A0ABV3R9B3_9SPHN